MKPKRREDKSAEIEERHTPMFGEVPVVNLTKDVERDIGVSLSTFSAGEKRGGELTHFAHGELKKLFQQAGIERCD